MDRFHNGDIPQQEEIYRVIGWPPGTTTNRPPPPTNSRRISPGVNGNGLPVVEVAADFTQWAASNVTVQLLAGGAIVGESNLPATLAASLASLGEMPTVISSPGIGTLLLTTTNRSVTVVWGLACFSGACSGEELRILADIPSSATPPIAYTGLGILMHDGMDMRSHSSKPSRRARPCRSRSVAPPQGPRSNGRVTASACRALKPWTGPGMIWLSVRPPPSPPIRRCDGSAWIAPNECSNCPACRKAASLITPSSMPH